MTDQIPMPTGVVGQIAVALISLTMLYNAAWHKLPFVKNGKAKNGVSNPGRRSYDSEIAVMARAVADSAAAQKQTSENLRELGRQMHERFKSVDEAITDTRLDIARRGTG